jgi:sensor c-di-GMP phosphodiesterase-like protein
MPLVGGLGCSGIIMGIFLRGLTRRNIVAIVAGVLFAGVPLVALDFWLGAFVDRRAQAEISIAAQRAVALVSTRVGQAAASLDALAAHGIDSCGPSAIDAMRRAAFSAPPVKELAILGPDGQPLCSGSGLLPDQRKLIFTEALAGAGDQSLDILRLPNAENMVRLRRKLGTGGRQVAALIPASLLLPQATVAGGRGNAFVKLVAPGGILVGVTGVRPLRSEPQFSVSATSDEFGFTYEIVVTREMVLADQADLRWLGRSVFGAMVLVMLGFVMLTRQRNADNPVTDLKNALAAGEFVPYYQPIVDIRSGQLRGAEVLMRWRKPDGTLVLPGAFIPLAESSGLIRAMTRHLMRRVCTEAGAALGARPALKVSFNFAGQLFSNDSIVKDVRNIFANSPIRMSQVVLEVTERDPIENFTETRRTIAALQGLGVRIAIDDVGTGHSGLSYMLKLGVDIIKIDKMFVDAIGTDRNSTTIVETLVDLAHNMRMDVVAEGVENFEQVVHLRELGIRSAQGYVFAPPLPGSSFLQLVEALDPLNGNEEAEPAETPYYMAVRNRRTAA